MTQTTTTSKTIASTPWRIARLLGKIVLVVYVVFLLLVLAVKYVLVPNIHSFKPWLEQQVSQALHTTVQVGQLQAGFHGIWPELSLTDVRLQGTDGRQGLHLPKVEAAVSWRSLAHAMPVFHRLQIDRPDVQVQRLADGKFNVAGLLIDPAQPGQGSALQWLLAQGEISITQGSLTWTDAQRGQPPLTLSKVDFLYQRNALDHRMALAATPPEQFGAPVDLRLSFSHGLFQRADDLQHWTGELYAALPQTDLAQWARYFDLPGQVAQGQGAARFWLDFEALTAKQITADLRLQEVRATLARELPPLQLASVDGRVQGSQLARGDASHDVKVTNLVMVTHDGKRIGPLNAAESFRAARGNAGASGAFSADALDIGLLTDLYERLPFTAPVREALAKFNPAGQLRQFKLVWQAATPGAPEGKAATQFKTSGLFEGLSIAAQTDRQVLQNLFPPTATATRAAAAPTGAPRPGVPGFANLSGRFDLTHETGTIELDSKQASLDFPGVFGQSVMPFDALALQADWKVGSSGVELTVNNAKFTNADLQGAVTALYKTGGKGPGVLDLQGTLARANVAAIHKYLPLRLPEGTREWVKNALKSGSVSAANFKVKGDLFDFPFHAAPGAKPSGEFLINAKASGVELDYVPVIADSGVRWLPLQEVSGTFVMERTRLAVLQAKGRVMDTQLSEVNLEVKDTQEHAPLVISGKTSGPAQDLIAYVNVSPISSLINKFTQPTEIKGNTQMDLNMKLPLADMRGAQVAGKVQFAGNDVLLTLELPAFSNTTAILEFNEKGIQIPGGRATVYGGQANFSGGTQGDGSLKFKGEGTAEVAQAKSLIAEPLLAALIGSATGSLAYKLDLGVRSGATDLKLTSDLTGVAFDYPGVASKTAAQSLPLTVSIAPNALANANVPYTDTITVSLGSAINAQLERVRQPNAQMRVVRGGVGINNEAVVPDNGVIAIVNFKSIDIDQWLRRLDELQARLPASPASASSTAAADQEQASLLPRLVALRADELVLGSKRWERVVAGASREGDVWQINLDATQLSGYATWRQAHAGSRDVLGRLTARLARLSIPQAQREEVARLLEKPAPEGGKASGASELPGIDLVVDEFELGGKKLGRVEVQARNQGAWQLEKLVVENPDAKLTGTGSWQRTTDGSARPMDLQFTLDIANAGNLLTRLGFANTVRNGAGTLTGKVGWRGIPLALDFASLNGEVQLSIESGGQFLKTDPGVGRLLGVLSLQSLPRRLSLDFRDVFSEGFVFDGINATAVIKNGVLTTENFKMKGPQATVAMAGDADLVRERQNLRLVVLPDINFGAVSFAYLFINPAIGLTSFLAQLVAREPLAKSLAQEFDVAGTWAEPTITKRERTPLNNTAQEPGEE
jgi:uncharacterized protein (TIGR02099 family)